MADPANPAELKKITEELIKAITSPQVIEQMRQFRNAAASGASHQVAGDLMSLESLKAAGANLPDGFRITSRVFEDMQTRTKIELGPWVSPPGIDIPVPFPKGGGNPQAVSGCAGGGAATVCACAGGGN